MEKNILLTIAYDGSRFSGWQRQPDRMTVQGYLEQTLSSLFKREILLSGTSRTDAGVHALGQRASFKAELGIPTEKIPLAVNNALCGREKGPFALAPVRILAAEEKPAEFHARFDAKGKQYIYKIRNSNVVDLFQREFVYHITKPLDIGAMKRAAGCLRGTHDFKSFEASGGNPRETTVRTIFDIDVVCRQESRRQMTAGDAGSREELSEVLFAGDVEICVSGDGFLYNMVRIIVGTLVDIGLGKLEAGEMENIIKAMDRTAAGHTAPPYGLYLKEVYYEERM